MAAPHRQPPLRPSGWWYLAALGLLVLGVVLAGRAVVDGFGDARRAGFDASVATFGAEQPLTIRDPGGYTIAYAGPVLVRSTGEQERLARDLGIAIRPAAGGEVLPLAPYDGLNDLEEDGQQYVPLLTVRFEEPGDYVLTTSPAPGLGLDLDRSGLVVSESPYRKLRDGLERAVVALVVGTALAILVTVILGQARGRAKRARAALAPPPGWTGGPPQQPPPPQQAWPPPQPPWSQPRPPGPPPGGGPGWR